MSYEYVLDAYAWIEYFKGSKKGEMVRSIIEGSKSCITPSVVIAELSDKYEREGHLFFKKDLAFILSKTTISGINLDFAIRAGKIKNIVRKKYKNKFGLADAIILATARSLKAVVVTGDSHFEKISNVVFLK